MRKRRHQDDHHTTRETHETHETDYTTHPLDQHRRNHQRSRHYHHNDNNPPPRPNDRDPNRHRIAYDHHRFDAREHIRRRARDAEPLFDRDEEEGVPIGLLFDDGDVLLSLVSTRVAEPS